MKVKPKDAGVLGSQPTGAVRSHDLQGHRIAIHADGARKLRVRCGGERYAWLAWGFMLQPELAA